MAFGITAFTCSMSHKRKQIISKTFSATEKTLYTPLYAMTASLHSRKHDQEERKHQRLSTSVPQEFLKPAIPDYLVRGTDLLSLDC